MFFSQTAANKGKIQELGAQSYNGGVRGRGCQLFNVNNNNCHPNWQTYGNLNRMDKTIIKSETFMMTEKKKKLELSSENLVLNLSGISLVLVLQQS